MKKKSSQSAFFNPRVLIGLFVLLAGVFLALVGSGAFSSVFAQGKQPRQSGGSNGAQDAPGTQTPDVVRMVGPVRMNQDVRSLPYVAPKAEFEERRLTRYPRLGTGETSAVKYVQAALNNICAPGDARATVHI